MKIISSHTNITNAAQINLGDNISHEVTVEIEDKIYTIDILAKDTLDAAEKILKMSSEEFFLHLKNNEEKEDY